MVDDEKRSTLEWKTLGLVAISFSLGIVAFNIFLNYESAEDSSFSVTELLSFTLSVLLSGASIVLAFAAIRLGRSSEDAIMRRGDESMKIQNEVFVKTTEALARIESSTGVTEKRIEDIIAGRAGDISHAVAEQARKTGLGPQKNMKGFEESVRKSLLENIKLDTDPKLREKIRKQRAKEERQETLYQGAHNQLLASISTSERLVAQKMGHAHPANSGDDAFDAIYVKDGEKIALSTFRPDAHSRFAEQLISGAISNNEVSAVSKLFVVLFTKDKPDKRIATLEHYLGLLRPDLASRIFLVDGHYGDVDSMAEQIVSAC